MRKPLLNESDDWDDVPLDKLLEESREIDAEFIDRRRPKQPVTMRVEPDLVTETKRIAARMGIGYQTLFRLWLNIGFARYRNTEHRKNLADAEPSRHR